MPRYHVRLGTKRTTVSLDGVAADYLALHLGSEPRTRAAHAAIVGWLQAKLDDNKAAASKRVSQWLLGQVLDDLVSQKIYDACSAWLDNRVSKPVNAAEPAISAPASV